MRQVSIRTIGLIRSTSLSDLACQWFTSLWMIQSLVDGWKHHLVPLGLLSVIEMCPLPQKPRQPFWHLDRELKRNACVCVRTLVFACIHLAPFVAMTPESSAFSLCLIGQPAHLPTGPFISGGITLKHLIPFLMVLQMGSVYFLSEELEAVMSHVPEAEQPGRALFIWHCAVREYPCCQCVEKKWSRCKWLLRSSTEHLQSFVKTWLSF